MTLDPLVTSAVNMDYADWRANGIVLASTTVVVAASVLIHYEGLNFLSRRFRKALSGTAPSHRRVLYGISACWDCI
jgi:hypothetical protein